MIAVRITKIAAATKVVYLKAPAGFPPWKILIEKTPTNELSSPATTIRIGVAMNMSLMSLVAMSFSTGNLAKNSGVMLRVAAMAIVAITEPTKDSKMSAPIPAMSPTLSPTLSAITPGFLGSSSGIPASTLPTRSAPTSAAFVNIPPPTRANRAIELAPMANPLMYFAIAGSPP